MADLTQTVARYVAAHEGPDAVSATPIQGVSIMCSTQERLPFRHIYKPSLCVVVQGAKKIELEDQTFDYAAGTALVVSVELPGYGSVVQASRAEPFLGMTIEFDIGLMRDVLEQMAKPPRPAGERLGVFVEQLSEPVKDCINRLVRLFDSPEAVPVLYPSIMRELYYWLLTGPNGREICKIAHGDSHTQRIADAIYLMRQHIARPLSIEDMASAARMGVSSFHQHFKMLTSMTPLQYHKQLRLLEARRLMVAEAANVTSAAFHVGYESPSQFSREYARLFGQAPKRDAIALKSLGATL
ncbi:AraC family transcriptional regulator [Rhizobium albus]|nr:AraC family transcriptional regulator [Rhizobium albus]